MVNLLMAFVSELLGYLLIIQFGCELVETGKKKYWSWRIVLACLNMVVAGMNIAEFISG